MKHLSPILTALLGTALVISGCGQSQPTPEAPVATEGGVQKATVTIDGGKYTPSVITVAQGKPVELTFTGGKDLGCGGTVVFKSLNQSKDVKTGESVTFTFTPDKAGDIRFTCGMDMYDGKVVVK